MLLATHTVDMAPGYQVEPMLAGAKNDTAARVLTRQDFEAMGSPTAQDIDPTDPQQLQDQDDRLFRAGAWESTMSYLRVVKLDGEEVVAFAKFGLMERAYESDFAERRVSRREWKKLPQAMAVYALIASEELPETDRTLILDTLLADGLEFTRTRLGENAFLNIFVHDEDPLLDIIKSRDFEQFGKRGVATNVPGVEQARYRRPAVFPLSDMPQNSLNSTPENA